MDYFLDTEFLEGSQKTLFGKIKPTIDLISIGLVSGDNREYYAISKDFNLEEAWNRWEQRTGEGDTNNTEPRLYWIRENILKPIYKELHRKEYLSTSQPIYKDIVYTPETELKFTYNNFKKLLAKYGKTNKQIAQEVKAFCTGDILSIEKAKYYNVQHKPCKFYAYYADYDWVAFCWLFGKMIDLPNGFPMYCRDLKQILDEKDMARQDGTNVVEIKNMENYPKQENGHNALDDARWNFKLFKFLQGIS
jgi:hypothetical protein